MYKLSINCAGVHIESSDSEHEPIGDDSDDDSDGAPGAGVIADAMGGGRGGDECGALGSDDEPAGDVDGGAAGGGGDGGPGGVVPFKSAFLDLQRESDNVKLMRHYLAESLNIYSFVSFPIVDGAGAIVDEKTFQILGPPAYY